jgi:hypothetical protein
MRTLIKVFLFSARPRPCARTACFSVGLRLLVLDVVTWHSTLTSAHRGRRDRVLAAQMRVFFSDFCGPELRGQRVDLSRGGESAELSVLAHHNANNAGIRHAWRERRSSNVDGSDCHRRHQEAQSRKAGNVGKGTRNKFLVHSQPHNARLTGDNTSLAKFGFGPGCARREADALRVHQPWLRTR